MPSRLKGIETVAPVRPSTTLKLCSEMPSRLKGIETGYNQRQ